MSSDDAVRNYETCQGDIIIKHAATDHTRCTEILKGGKLIQLSRHLIHSIITFDSSPNTCYFNVRGVIRGQLFEGLQSILLSG